MDLGTIANVATAAAVLVGLLFGVMIDPTLSPRPGAQGGVEPAAVWRPLGAATIPG